MLSLQGTYKNGLIKLDKPLKINKSLKVIVTFIDEEIDLDDYLTNEKLKNETIDINKFSFLQSIEASKNFTGSFSDSIIEERRADL